MEWQGALAIYGACVGTLASLAAGWSIWAIVRDRGYLKLELRLKRVAENSYGGEIEKPVDRLEGCELCLIAVNVGRRPIMPDSWHETPRRQTHGAVDITFGKSMRQDPLDETKALSLVSRDFVEVFTSGLRRMYVTDSSGRRWYVPRNHLRAITKRIKTLQQLTTESRSTDLDT